MSQVEGGKRAEGFRKWVPRKVFWPKVGEKPDCFEYYIKRNLVICNPRQKLFGCSNQEEWNRVGMQDLWGKTELHAWFRCSNEPSGSKNAENFLTNWELASFSRRTRLHGLGKLINWLFG